MSDPRRLIATPLGQPGSGRVRYGAAMALHRAGELGDAALEVYRICAAKDAEDPAPLLGALGLAPPAAPDAGGSEALGTLLDEIDRHLAGRHGPGIAEARQAIAAARRGGGLAVKGTPNAVVAAHLAPALVQLAERHPALAAAIAGAAPHLDWQTYDAYPPDAIGPDFAQGHAFASLIGGGAPFAATDFDLGLLVIAPHVLYRDHHHAAPELYLPLTGPHGWRFGPGTPLVILPAGRPVWNDPFAPHLTKVGPVPFLSLFAWTRDVDAPASVIPADDWPALEALRL
jgi:hypothetical protein